MRAPASAAAPALALALVACCLVPVRAQVAVNASAIAAWRPTSFLTVCVAPWDPMVTCSNDTLPSSWTGHDVELMRAVMEALDVPYGSGYNFRCVRFSDMILDLHTPGGNCSMAIAGITINIARQELGIKFSYPYYKSSLGIMVRASTETGNGWGFIHPFSWSLWLAILLTIMVVPFCVVVVEFLAVKRHIARSDWLPGLREASVRTLWTLMTFDNFNVSAPGTRVLVLTFGFMSLLLVATYTANLAAFITVSRIASTITSVQDLRGKAVASHGPYIAELRDKYGVVAVDIPFNSQADFAQMADDVAAGRLVAAIDDEPAMTHLASSYPGCVVAVLPDTIAPFDYGIAFHMNTSDVEVDAFSLQILAQQENGYLEQLRENFIDAASGSCQTTSKVTSDAATTVSFYDIYGLWVILAGGLVIGLCLMLAQRTHRRVRKNKVSWKTDGVFPSSSINLERAAREAGKKRQRGGWRRARRTGSASSQRSVSEAGDSVKPANGTHEQQLQQLDGSDSGDLEGGSIAFVPSRPSPPPARPPPPPEPDLEREESELHNVETIFSAALASSAWKQAARRSAGPPS